MIPRQLILLPLCLVSSITIAAEPPKPPSIPSKPIAEKKELLFEDNFESGVRDKRWHRVIDTFVVENGQLKGSQTREKDVPAVDGKPAVVAHHAVHGLELLTKDSIVEVKIRFGGNTMFDIEFDDRKYKGSGYGHLCRAQVRVDKVILMDEREGGQNLALIEMKKDPAKRDEALKLMNSKNAYFTLPSRLEVGKTYTLTVETVRDEMRVSLDGKGVGFLKSPGIGHETKSKIEIGVGGKDGYLDDLKIWNAAPAAK